MNCRCFLVILACLVAFDVGNYVRGETPLEVSMKHMSKALKELSVDLQQPQDASKGDYVALAGTLQKEAQTSRGLVPKKVATLPADQQDAMVKAYQKSMDDLMQTISTLTQDLQATKWDEARKDIAKIKEQETEGHKTFRMKK
jgi:soluble cytochrome b562